MRTFHIEIPSDLKKMSETTEILIRISDGELAASAELLPLVYAELKQLASKRLMQDPAGNSLQTTELVHEAYMRLVGDDKRWENNAHFFGAASQAMRRILVERARQKKQQKRGGEFRRVELSDMTEGKTPTPEELLLVDDLLDRFAEEFPDEAELVKMKYFGGFNVTEAARILQIPSSTAHRHWSFAKSWIFRELKKEV